jgi:predicted Na+-dependent transporter
VVHMQRIGCLSLCISQYRELVIVAVGAVIGLTVQSPLAWLVRHQGIDTLLVILVFSTAVTIDPLALRRLPASWRALSLALVVGVSVLPAFSWLAAHLVHRGALHDGVLTIGLAPCEIASIATTAMAGGDVALAGGVLIGSTVLSVAAAGPILALETRGASVHAGHAGHILVNLLIIVAAPLVAGIAVRSVVRLTPRAEVVASTTGTLAVAALVALVAAEVHFSTEYLAVLAALLAFLIASSIVGHLVGRTGERASANALLLTISMRDFAIAAGMAAAAFGPRAAAPLGLYGITVLVWGTGVAGFLRARRPA